MIVTCTPSREPIVNRVKPGALVVALGADAPGKGNSREKCSLVGFVLGRAVVRHHQLPCGVHC